MPTQVTNYKCPSCSGPLHFSEASGRLECDFCGGSYAVAEIEALYARQEQAAVQAHDAGGDGWDLSSAGGEWGAEGENMRAYSCPSCGAELICDATTAATSCPYCGNPTVIPGQLGGVLKPNYVIPFRLDKSAAVSALKRHCRGKALLPKSFRDKNHLEEVKGVYVPFWLFDASVDADVSFSASISTSHTSGDYEITDTEHYDVRRAGTVSFERIPVDGSSKMPDDYMDSIEPYDYGELQRFSTAYLPGFLADKYDVDAVESSVRADQRASASAVDCLSATVTGYDSVTPEAEDIRLSRGQVKYALLPVWLLSTKWNGENYLFAMNGQTGKLVGDLPVSKGRLWAWFFGISMPLAAALSYIVFFI